jgi:hypothetical protein
VIRRLFRSAAVDPRPVEPDVDCGDPGTAVIEGYQVATDPDAQRQELLSLVVVQGRNGPRAFLDNVSAALSEAMAVDDALDAYDSLRTVVATIQREIDDELAAFTADAHTVLGDVLTDSENRAKAEAEVDDALSKVARVRAANRPGGGVDVFTLGRLVALTKARRMIAEGSWQAKVIDEHAVDLATTSALAGLGFAARGPALVVRARAGGASHAARLQAETEIDPGGQGLRLVTATDAGLSDDDVNMLAAEIVAGAHAPAL